MFTLTGAVMVVLPGVDAAIVLITVPLLDTVSSVATLVNVPVDAPAATVIRNDVVLSHQRGTRTHPAARSNP